MRELHVVAMSEDGRHVVLATSKGAATGGFRVALDDRLAAAVRGELPRPGEAPPADVTPKEIQARLRGGESPEQIAASAGVPLSKIERYAGPVLSERERVLDQARAGFVSRSRLGPSALPLGEAVDRHLADTTGVRLDTVSWSARREETGTWLVELSYVSQARRRTATWRYDVVRREVTATDSASAALAHVEPGRRARATEPSAAPVPVGKARRTASARATSPGRTIAARPAVASTGRPAGGRAAAPATKAVAPAKAAQAAAGKAAAAKAAREQAVRAAAQERAASAAAASAAKQAAERTAQQTADRTAKAEAAKAAAEKAAAEKAAAEKVAAEKVAAEKVAAEKVAAEKVAAEKVAAEKVAAEKVAAEKVAADVAQSAQEPNGPPTLRVVGAQDPPVAPRREPKEPPAAARTAPARAAGQRASVPGWADVLLSTAPVARPTDPPAEGD